MILVTLPLSDLQNFCLSPDGQELAVVGTEEIEEITFWNLDGGRVTLDLDKEGKVEKWMPSFSAQIVSYTSDGDGIFCATNKLLLSYARNASKLSYKGFWSFGSDIQEPERTRATHLAFSVDGNLVLTLFDNGQLSLHKYMAARTSFLKTLFHEGAIAFLHHPTALESNQLNPFSFVNQDAYTLEMWVRPSLNATGFILAKGSLIGTEYEVSVNNGRFMISIDQKSYDGGVYKIDTFSHLAVVTTNQGANVSIYLNGELVKPDIPYGERQAPPVKLLEIAKTSLLIGASIIDPYPQTRDWTSDQSLIPSDVKSFIGIISEIRIWNKALTQFQIQTYANWRLPHSAKEHGLIGYWRFEEVQNSTIKNLVSDNDYGVVVGAEPLPQTEIPSRFTLGLEFNQPNDYVNCGNDASLNTTTAITAEAWVKHIGGNGWVINRLNPDRSNTTGYGLAWQDGKIRVILQAAGHKTIVDTRYNAPSDRTFHHIAFTWGKGSADQNLSELLIYIDGRLQETISVEGAYSALLIDNQYRNIALFKASLEAIQVPLVIGSALSTQNRSALSSHNQCHWIIAEVRLWNLVRTQNQIQSTMSSHLSQMEPGLVGYWRLDDRGLLNRIARNAVADWQGKTEAVYHGVIQGANWFPALDSRCPKGTVNCGQDAGLNVSEAITIETWVKHTSGNLWIVSCTAPEEGGYILAWQDNKIYFVLRGHISSAPDNTGFLAGSVDKVIDDQAEHHLAFTWNNAQEVKVYIDSIQCNCTVSTAQPLVSNPHKFVWGSILDSFRVVNLKENTGEITPFAQNNFSSLGEVSAPLKIGLPRPSQDVKNQWAIHEVRLWNVARTPEQIRSSKDKLLTQDTAPGLVGYWRFDKQSETNGRFRNIVADWQGRTEDRYHAKVEDEIALAFPSASPPLNPGSNTSNPGSNTSSPGSGTSNPGSGTSNPGLDTSNLGSNTSSPGSGTDATPSSPSDIANHWAKLFIDFAIAQNILPLQTEGLFKPDDPVSLGAFISAVVKAFDRPLRMEAIAFSNLPTTDALYDDAQKAYRMGFVLGSSDNTIDLNRNLDRMEVMTCLVRGLDLKGGTVNLLSVFSDRNAIPLNVRRAMATAVYRGLAVNPPDRDRLEPRQPITRAELATLIYQGRVILGSATAIASPYLVTVPATVPFFIDISPAPPQKHWAADFIGGLVDRGLVHGFRDGSFKPDDTMTRAEYASLLVRAFNPSPRSDRGSINIAQPQLFSDVAASHPYFNEIQQIYQSGGMSGLPDRSFGAVQPIRRDQMIAVLVALLGLPDGNPDALTAYSDRSTIANWARLKIAAATAAGLVVGKDYPTSRHLRADQPATRAEIAVMVYQGLLQKGLVTTAISSAHIASAGG